MTQKFLQSDWLMQSMIIAKRLYKGMQTAVKFILFLQPSDTYRNKKTVKRPISTEKTGKVKKMKIDVIKKSSEGTNSLPENGSSSSSSEIENKQARETISNESHYEAYLISKYKRIVRFVSSEGEFRLDLRKLGENGNPTSAGIVLDKAQFETFASLLPQLEEKVEDAIRGKSTNFKKGIGGNAMVKVNDDYCCVDIRHYYLDRNDGTRKPTQRGITFNKNEFDVVKSLLNMLYAVMMQAQKRAQDIERKEDAIENRT